MDKTTLMLILIIVVVSSWFAFDHYRLSGKLADATTAFTNMQEQSYHQAQAFIILQSCAATAEGIHTDTGKYYSVMDCASKMTQEAPVKP